ncbi:MAG: hypothetical protein KIS67_06780 [Verrucomicrobiae bacterium]|nr:hypothetical protein [Verrucomicrobiae bacterium]
MSLKRIIKPGASEVLFWILNGSIGFVDNSVFPLELSLVERLLALVDAPFASSLRKQFDCYNSFWRGGEWRTFEMRRVVRGQVSFPSELKVETEKNDVRIASMKFSTSGSATVNWAVSHLVNGRFFSIEFGESYKPIRFAREIQVLEFRPNRELAQMVGKKTGR